MSQATLFPMARRHHWAKLDYQLIDRKDCTASCRSLILALLMLSDGADSLCHTRNEIRAAANLGLNAYLAAMRWLKSAGAIEDQEEHRAKSGRRIVLQWVRDPTWSFADTDPNASESIKRGAPEIRRGRARNQTGARPKSDGGAPESARLYLIGEFLDWEEKEDVPSPTPSLTPQPSGPVMLPGGTGRDVFAPLPEEDGEIPKAIEIPQTVLTAVERPAIPVAVDLPAEIAKVEAMIATISASRPRSPALVGLRERLDRLRSGDYSARLPDDAPRPRGTPSAPPCGPPSTKFRPDVSVRIDEAFALCRAPTFPSDGVDRFAQILAARWRDSKPETIACYRAAARKLPADVLIQEIQAADTGARLDAARMFSRNAGRIMSQNARAEIRRQRG